MVDGGSISWKIHKQETVSLSKISTKLNLSQPAAQEVAYLCETLRDFWYQQSEAAAFKKIEDELACIAMNENAMRKKFSRHIDIRFFGR